MQRRRDHSVGVLYRTSKLWSLRLCAIYNGLWSGLWTSLTVCGKNPDAALVGLQVWRITQPLCLGICSGINNAISNAINSAIYRMPRDVQRDQQCNQQCDQQRDLTYALGSVARSTMQSAMRSAARSTVCQSQRSFTESKFDSGVCEIK